MEIRAAGDNTLYGTAQGILLVLVRDTEDVNRKAKLTIIVLVQWLKKNMFSALAAVQKGVKVVIAKGGSILDLGSFSSQLKRTNNFDNFDLAITKESKRTELACCAVWGKTFRNETVLTTSLPQKTIAPSAGGMDNDLRALENDSARYNNDSPTYRIHERTSICKSSDISCCEKANPASSMVNNFEKGNEYLDDLENVYDGI